MSLNKYILFITLISITIHIWIANGDFQDTSILNSIIILTNSRYTLTINSTNVQQISNSLNYQYARFWNVIQILPDQSKPNNQTDTSESILFGYSYKMHWFWGCAPNGKGVIFIIWKDYNCKIQVHQHMSTNFDNMAGTVSDVSQLIDTYPDFIRITPNNSQNIWDRAVTIYDYLNGIFKGSYTVIMGQYVEEAYGSICTGKAFNQYTGAQITNQSTYMVRYQNNMKSNFILVMKMNEVYQDKFNGTKLTLPTVPPCLKGKTIIPKRISVCDFKSQSNLLNNIDNSEEVTAFVIQNLPLRFNKLTSLYKASDHNCSITKFHELCDNNSPTLTIFKTYTGKTIAMYTPSKWNPLDSNNHRSISDYTKASRILQLNLRQVYTITPGQEETATTTSNYDGPIFGLSDIQIKNGCVGKFGFPQAYNLQSNPYERNNRLKDVIGDDISSFLIVEWQVLLIQ